MGETPYSDLESALSRRESERQLALIEDRAGDLAALLDDDLVHVHATGNVHSKSQLLHHAFEVLDFVAIDRGPLAVRQLGPNAAVMTGSMTNHVRRRGDAATIEVNAFVTQVWIRTEGDIWKLTNFHAVRLGDAHQSGN